MIMTPCSEPCGSSHVIFSGCESLGLRARCLDCNKHKWLVCNCNHKSNRIVGIFVIYRYFAY